MASIIKVDTIQDQDGNNIINENANTITIGASGDTISIPSGATLANSGTASGFGISWQSAIKTASFTAVAGEGYLVNTTSGAITITLPASASVGDQIIFTDYARTWGTNSVTLNRNGLNIQGGANNAIYAIDGQSVNIVYSGATQGWIPNSDDNVINVNSYDVEFLVVAGGGGGGWGIGGGGAAVCYRTSTQTLNIGTTITATVGDGGASQTVYTATGFSVTNSSISGNGL